MWSKKIVFSILFIGVSFVSYSQKNRYVVYFTDKSNSPFSIDVPEDFLSARAIDRRDRLGIPVVTEDLPVNPNYLDSLSAKGVEVHLTSRWFNLALIEATEGDLVELNQVQIVDTIILVAPGEKLNAGRIKRTFKTAAATDQQNAFHNIDQMHDKGFTGEGIWVAVMDAGFIGVNNINAFQHIFADNRVIITHNFVENNADVYQYSDHGTKVLSLIAGFEEGQFVGGAYNAHIGLFVTEDVSSEYRIEEYNWLLAAEMADSAGFDIINTALGYNTFDDPSMNYTYEDMDGQTAIITQASNEATARGILTVTSAGNAGNSSWKFLTAPADAFGNLSVGAVDMNGNKASFSSIGPSADGRIKPEIAALGVGVKVINSSGNIESLNGTSFSAPIATSLMAGIYQEFPALSIAGLKALAFEWSSQTFNPDNSLGYGILKYGGAVTAVEDELHLLQIYPNPVKDYLMLDLLTPPESVEVFDITGQKLPLHYDNKSRVDVSSLANGVYLLMVKARDELFVTKFIKE